MRFNCLVKKVSLPTAAAELYRHLFTHSKYSYWLDSSRVDGSYARFSFIGDNSGPYAHVASYRVEDGFTVVTTGEKTRIEEKDIFGFLEAKLAESVLIDSPALPFDFCGGYVGYLGYELMAVTEHVQGKHSTLPDAQILFSDRFIAIDHLYNELYLVVLHPNDPLPATAWIDTIIKQLEQIAPQPAPRTVEICKPAALDPYLLRDKQSYLSDIALCKEKIEAGESYEICLTNRVRIPLSRCDSAEIFNVYLTLRDLNPAPYACFMKSLDAYILCSSPERFLQIDQNGQVESRPIKGTMPRDPDPIKDEANREQLSADRRFFSENLMIVDLLRNDLSRSCVPGTVSVPALMKVESYATVHQLVSTIRGTLQASASHCVAKCFPGGSMTGAPKKRTLEIINEIEHEPRGIYSGAIGYFSLNGTVDLNIVIRTVVIHQNKAEIGVGGAITYLSNPEQEYDEMILKALAPFSAVAQLI